MKHFRLTLACYMAATAFSWFFNWFYSFFSHDVWSAAMAHMWRWPLILGVLAFLALWLALPDAPAQKGYRLFFNLWNSGVAVQVVRKGIQGILEIAGGTSDLLPVFRYAAYGLLGLAALCFVPVGIRALLVLWKRIKADGLYTALANGADTPKPQPPAPQQPAEQKEPVSV